MFGVVKFSEATKCTKHIKTCGDIACIFEEGRYYIAKLIQDPQKNEDSFIVFKTPPKDISSITFRGICAGSFYIKSVEKLSSNALYNLYLDKQKIGIIKKIENEDCKNFNNLINNLYEEDRRIKEADFYAQFIEELTEELIG